MDRVWLNDIKTVFPSFKVITDREKMVDYAHDEGVGSLFYPDAVVFAENEEDILEVVKIANRYSVPITPRSAGSNVVGAAVPLKGGIVLSFERMNRIVEINPVDRVAVVEPGVINYDLKQKVEEYGLFYPPDPASLDLSTIGGNVAQNAGGPSCVKYGVTKDYVLGLRVVLVDGSIIETGGRVHKNSTGYNLTSLMIGSEGTLGIFSQITLKLLPLPSYRIDFLMGFDNVKEAVSASSLLLSSSLHPVNIEFMERRAIYYARTIVSSSFLPQDAKALLLVGFDGFEPLDRVLESIDKLFSKNAKYIGVGETKQERARLWKLRRSLHDALKQVSPTMDREDIVVPISKIPDIITFVKELEKEEGFEIVVFGHMGDGNLHVDILKKDADINEWEEKRHRITEKLLKHVIELGGKISGEHGIGYLKKDYLPLGITEKELALYKGIKNVFDPKNILNPLKIF